MDRDVDNNNVDYFIDSLNSQVENYGGKIIINIYKSNMNLNIDKYI